MKRKMKVSEDGKRISGELPRLRVDMRTMYSNFWHRDKTKYVRRGKHAGRRFDGAGTPTGDSFCAFA